MWGSCCSLKWETERQRREKRKEREGGKKSKPILGPVRGYPTRTLKPLRCAPGWSAARPIRRVGLWRCCPLGPGHLGRRGGPGGGVVWRRQGQLCWRGSRAGGGPQRPWSQSPPASPRCSHCSGSHLPHPGLRRNNKGHLWAWAWMAHNKPQQHNGLFWRDRALPAAAGTIIVNISYFKLIEPYLLNRKR